MQINNTIGDAGSLKKYRYRLILNRLKIKVSLPIIFHCYLHVTKVKLHIDTSQRNRHFRILSRVNLSLYR